MARRKRKDDNNTAIEIVLWALVGVPTMGGLLLAEFFRGLSRKAKRGAARQASCAPYKHKSSKTSGVQNRNAKNASNAARIHSYDDARGEMVRGMLIPTLKMIVEQKSI